MQTRLPKQPGLRQRPRTLSRCRLVVRANVRPTPAVLPGIARSAAAAVLPSFAAAFLLVSPRLGLSSVIACVHLVDQHHTSFNHDRAGMQAVNPAGASVYEKPNTANLGTQSRNAAAELEAIISSRTGSVRALPTLTSSPALLVGQLGWGTASSSGGRPTWAAAHPHRPQDGCCLDVLRTSWL